MTTHPTTQPSVKSVMMIGAVLIIGIIGYYILTAPDKRSVADKISDAVHALPDGTDKAARQLENRTPGEKLNDAATDARTDLRKAANQQK
jgi:hypothetical protein